MTCGLRQAVAVVLLVAATGAHAAVELGRRCIEFSHPAYDNGRPHLLILDLTWHTFAISIAGADDTMQVPVSGTAYVSPRHGLIFSIVKASPGGGSTYGLTATFSSGPTTAGLLELLADGTRFDPVDTRFVACPPGPQ